MDSRDNAGMSSGKSLFSKPLVFVAMPFGKKRDFQTASDIDFDVIYERGIRPAVARFDVDCVRADEERSGGVIHLAMFERLLLAEIAVVDVTLQNANVFYELGVRHAARPRSTIIIRANDSQLPFDINMLRAIGYRLENGVLSEDAASELQDAIARKLEHALVEVESHDSPLFQLIPKFPGIMLDHEVTESFRDRARYVDAIRERLAAARSQRPFEIALASIDKIASEVGPITENNAEIFVDIILSYRDVKAWDAMIGLVERFPNPILRRVSTLREQYALALNRRGSEADRKRALAIIDEMVAEHGDNPESCGIAGRVYKDMYSEAKQRGEKSRASGYLDRAIDWYRRGFLADPRDYYPGVNLATLLAVSGTQEATAELGKVAPAVSFAIARLGGMTASDYWIVATVCEVAVLSSDFRLAERALGRMLSFGPARWMLESTRDNLLKLGACPAIDSAEVSALVEELNLAIMQ